MEKEKVSQNYDHLDDEPLNDHTSITRREVIVKIAYEVCKHTEIPFEVIFSKSRKREIVNSRQLVQTLAKRHTSFSLESIGRLTGNRDHATVLNAIKTVDNLCDTDDNFNSIYILCEENIKILSKRHLFDRQNLFVLILTPHLPGDDFYGYAEKCFSDSLKRNELPVCPYIHYKPTSEVLISMYDEMWLNSIDILAVYNDFNTTVEMNKLMNLASELNIKIEFRKIVNLE